jgi:hypothetical protein
MALPSKRYQGTVEVYSLARDISVIAGEVDEPDIHMTD